MLGAGIVQPTRPGQAVRLGRNILRWRLTPVSGIATLAATDSDRPYVIDECGTVTFGEIHARSNALADALAERGVRTGDRVGLMCRNHRYFVEAILACYKLGTTTLLLNTDFAAPQLAGVLEREQVRLVIHDSEFTGPLPDGPGLDRVIAWSEGEHGLATVDELTASGSPADRKRPADAGHLVILSSGTTGTPKGVQRGGSASLYPLLGFLDRVGLRARETHFITSPMFHGWGVLYLGYSFLLGSTIVLRRRFEPEATLALIERHRPQVVPMVPVMLQRIMELPADVRRGYDTSSVRAILLSGSAVPGGLATRAMDAFGDIVYNIYGSTEVALATAATPADLRADPHTAGTPLTGASVQVLDGNGRPLPTGETGRIFVGSDLRSEGYTGGGQKEDVDGLLSSGDVGHFDAEGRLHVDGRDDDMIVSGGENVYPGEVEDLLADHPAIAEAAVIGVPDDSYGQRLCAFVVARGELLTAEQVKSYVREHLARYKVPREVSFLDELPRNPTGKVLKRELRERLPSGKS
jgi:fatty-acyl-CoA synthase